MFNEVRAAPKPSFGRRIPKRKSRSEFSPKVRKIILERDNYQCVRCGKRVEHIHHVLFRSQVRDNSPTNGVCVCSVCHSYAHSGREGREFFEQYRIQHLLGKGE